MAVPQDLRYSKTREWVKVDADMATLGITDFAQNQLSDLTFVELPSVGDEISAEGELAVVESVKAASDVYSPISGTVTEVNEALDTQPELINTDPFGDGWICKIQVRDPSELDGLMAAADYQNELPAES